MRAVTAIAALAPIAACSQSGDGGQGSTQPVAMIACAVGTSGAMTQSCGLERHVADGHVQFVVRHPDGGFRRFTLSPDGAGLIASDGSERATSAVASDHVDISVGQDRYRFPAAILKTDHAV